MAPSTQLNSDAQCFQGLNSNGPCKNKGREKRQKPSEQVVFNLSTYVPNGTEISKRVLVHFLMISLSPDKN